MGVFYLPANTVGRRPTTATLKKKKKKNARKTVFVSFIVRKHMPLVDHFSSFSPSSSPPPPSPGARVNAKDNKWLTPLHRAVASCSEVFAFCFMDFVFAPLIFIIIIIVYLFF